MVAPAPSRRGNEAGLITHAENLPCAARAPDLQLGASLDRTIAHEVRRVMELRHFKWDAQVGDVSALAPAPLLMRSSTWRSLAKLAEQLYAETVAIEAELRQRPALHARLGLPRTLRELFARHAPSSRGPRVMRFDFHPTPDGWRISEVNSDVPGGYTEATHFTSLMATHTPGARTCGDPTSALVASIAAVVSQRGTVALLCAPGHMEDEQVVAHLAHALRGAGITAYVLSLAQLDWTAGRARLGSVAIDLVYRFYQAEWLARLRRRSSWEPLFVDGDTRVVSPGVAALSESKRLPLIWDALRTPIPTWRRLLPETRALADAPWATDDGWLIKSAYSNNGDTVLIRESMSAWDWTRRTAAARLRPSRWVAQRRFSVLPVQGNDRPMYPCIGVYVVDGNAAGCYARITDGPVITYAASDVALLVYDDA